MYDNTTGAKMSIIMAHMVINFLLVLTIKGSIVTHSTTCVVISFVLVAVKMLNIYAGYLFFKTEES